MKLLRRSLAPLLVLACLAPSAAQAKSGYCSPTGDYCYSSVRVEGSLHLRLTTFSFRGSVKVCVRAPDASRRCKSFRLHREKAGIFAADATWSAHFPDKGRGTYRVTYTPSATRTMLGPGTTFRRSS